MPRQSTCQFGLDRRDESGLEFGRADLLHDLGEEAEHDEAARLVFADAASHEVEQVLVVETAGRARVAGADDVAGLDLEVRDGVGAGAVGEHEVAVLLVAVGADGGVADEHVADPDRARAGAVQRALVGDAAPGVRRVVVHVDLLLEVLAGVGEVEAERLDVGALLGEVSRRVHPHDLAAERDDDVLQ